MPMSRIKTWEELTIQDNFLFQKVMRNKRLCQHLIEKILQIQIVDITYPDAEKTIDVRLDSKSVRLDVYVKDDTGRVFDIEMQCSNEPHGGLAKRTRYYQAMIDMDETEKGAMYEDLKPTYIIFICTFDPFLQGLPKYTFTYRCAEQPSLELGDEGVKLFLNSKGDSAELDPDVRAFLRYVDGKAAEGVFVTDIDREVRRIKQHDETRREYMTLAMELQRQKKAGFEEGEKHGLEKGEKIGLEKGLEKGEKIGLEKGLEKGKLLAAMEMLRNGLSVEMVSKCTQLSIEYILELGKKNRLL